MQDIPNELGTWIVQNGRSYVPAICPDDIQRGPCGLCFDTSILNAYRTGYRYVEGMAFMRTQGFFALHAWVTDGTHAYDPTWRAYKDKVEVPMPTVYIGVELDTARVVEFMSKTDYSGVIANAWRDKRRAREILPEGCPIMKW